MSSIDEIKRIRAAYDGYRASARVWAQWNRDNAGNRASTLERRLALAKLIQIHGLAPLGQKKILEIGCGNGDILLELIAEGARRTNLFGIDLLPERIVFARRRLRGAHLSVGNAGTTDFESCIFDVVVLHTVLSSILDGQMRSQVTSEAQRVLKPGGGILWYDLRYNNPWNRNVRGVTKAEISKLFAGYGGSLQTITLLPPLARRLGKATDVVYPWLSRIPSLRTHYIGLLVKP